MVAETLPTFKTFVRFLSCVDPLMARESGALTECLPTLRALVGFFHQSVFAGMH